jgi:hypothetical protein
VFLWSTRARCVTDSSKLNEFIGHSGLPFFSRNIRRGPESTHHLRNQIEKIVVIEIVEAAGVELSARDENKEVIENLGHHKTLNPHKWAFHCTRIAHTKDSRCAPTNKSSNEYRNAFIHSFQLADDSPATDSVQPIGSLMAILRQLRWARREIPEADHTKPAKVG